MNDKTKEMAVSTLLHTIENSFTNYGDIVTSRDLCAMLGLGRNSVSNLLVSGKIESICVGRRRIITKIAVLNFLNKNSCMILAKTEKTCYNGMGERRIKEDVAYEK